MSASLASSSAAAPQKRPPPQVSGLPWLGNALALLRDPLAFLRETRRTHGDIFEVRAGPVKFVVLAGLEANQLMVKESSELFRSWEFWKGTVAEMECPHSFIAVDGEPHKYQRVLMMPLFAKSVFTGRLADVGATMRDTLQARHHQKTFVSALFRHVVSQQIGGTLQGYKPTPVEVEALMYYQSAAMNVGSLKRWPRWMLSMPRYRKAKRLVWELADRIIDSARTGGQATYLQSLLQRGQAERPDLFTPGDVRNHAIITFLAGIDTMGATLSFMLLQLLRQPELRHKVQEEVDALWARGTPTCDDLEDMDVMQRFIKEILRLYPTAFAVRRTAVKDFTFQGYDIPQGQDLLLFTTSMHTDEKYFADPLRFDIDRYLPPRSEPARADAFAPFGKGPHSCIGAGVARVLLALNIGQILHHCEIEAACDLDRVKMAFHDPTAALSRSFAVKLTPRRGGN